MRRARDAMSRNVVVIREHATVEEAIHSLLKHRVSGAPVVDAQGQLVGIISEFQLLEAIYRPEVKQELVRDLMTKDVITVTDESILSEVANMFLLHRIRRVPVLCNGEMVGLISHRDLLKCTVDAEHTQGGPGAKVKACSCGH